MLRVGLHGAMARKYRAAILEVHESLIGHYTLWQVTGLFSLPLRKFDSMSLRILPQGPQRCCTLRFFQGAPKERRRGRAEKRLSKRMFLESPFLLCPLKAFSKTFERSWKPKKQKDPLDNRSSARPLRRSFGGPPFLLKLDHLFLFLCWVHWNRAILDCEFPSQAGNRCDFPHTLRLKTEKHCDLKR